MKRLLLFTLLIAKTVYSMENVQLSSNSESIMPYVNTGILATQALSLTLLKKHGYLFGSKRMPHEIKIPYTHSEINVDNLLGSIADLGFMTVPSAVLECSDSYLKISVTGLVLLTSLIHFAHLSYQDSLKKAPLGLKSKIRISPQILADSQCPICLESITDPINPCNQADHIYCRRCLATWLNTMNEDGRKLSCSLCTQKICSEKVVMARSVSMKLFGYDLIKIKNIVRIPLCVFGLYKVIRCII